MVPPLSLQLLSRLSVDHRMKRRHWKCCLCLFAFLFSPHCAISTSFIDVLNPSSYCEMELLYSFYLEHTLVSYPFSCHQLVGIAADYCIVLASLVFTALLVARICQYLFSTDIWAIFSPSVSYSKRTFRKYMLRVLPSQNAVEWNWWLGNGEQPKLSWKKQHGEEVARKQVGCTPVISIMSLLQWQRKMYLSYSLVVKGFCTNEYILGQ